MENQPTFDIRALLPEARHKPLPLAVNMQLPQPSMMFLNFSFIASWLVSSRLSCHLTVVCLNGEICTLWFWRILSVDTTSILQKQGRFCHSFLNCDGASRKFLSLFEHESHALHTLARFLLYNRDCYCSCHFYQKASHFLFQKSSENGKNCIYLVKTRI